MNTKTRKKVTNKRMPKKMKKNVKTFYGIVTDYSLKNCVDKSGMDAMIIDACKSDHPNHCINSFLAQNPEMNINRTVLVKVEVVGKPMVKTTREITIKK